VPGRLLNLLVDDKEKQLPTTRAIANDIYSMQRSRPHRVPTATYCEGPRYIYVYLYIISTCWWAVFHHYSSAPRLRSEKLYPTDDMFSNSEQTHKHKKSLVRLLVDLSTPRNIIIFVITVKEKPRVWDFLCRPRLSISSSRAYFLKYSSLLKPPSPFWRCAHPGTTFLSRHAIAECCLHAKTETNH